jgi:hypothetical protein
MVMSLRPEGVTHKSLVILHFKRYLSVTNIGLASRAQPSPNSTSFEPSRVEFCCSPFRVKLDKIEPSRPEILRVEPSLGQTRLEPARSQSMELCKGKWNYSVRGLPFRCTHEILGFWTSTEVRAILDPVKIPMNTSSSGTTMDAPGH